MDHMLWGGVCVHALRALQLVWVTFSARAGRRRRGFCCWHNRRRKTRDRTVDSGGNACAFHRLLLLLPHQNAKLDSGRLVGSDISVHFFLGNPDFAKSLFLFHWWFWDLRGLMLAEQQQESDNASQQLAMRFRTQLNQKQASARPRPP